MQPSIDDVRYDLAMTRARMAATLEEIDTRLDEQKSRARERIDAVKRRADLATIANDHPWACLAVAVALGFAIGGSGADRKAVEATADAARALPDLAASAGGAVMDKVRDLRGGSADGDGTALEAMQHADEPGMLDRIAGSLGEVMGLDQFVAELAEASRTFATRSGSSVA